MAAGIGATRAAVRGDDPKLLIVFCSAGYDLETVRGAVRSCYPAVPLIGCSTAGEIAVEGSGEGERPGAFDSSVAVFALGGPGFDVATASADVGEFGLHGAGEHVARRVVNGTTSPHSVILVLMDAFVGDHQEILRGVYGVVGAGVPLVGGVAGDDMRMEQTHQIHDDRLLTDHVVVAAVTSDGPIGIGVRHGWKVAGEPMLVTDSEPHRVLTLDHRPALDMYLERLGAPPEAFRSTEAFTPFALTRPLGLLRHTREPQARGICTADFEQRSLQCNEEVQTGALVYAMEGSADSVQEATDAACEEALAGLEGADPLGLLAFDCVGRKGLLGDEGPGAEIERIAKHGNGAPLAGFYTYGEVARIHGANSFYNYSLVVLAVG